MYRLFQSSVTTNPKLILSMVSIIVVLAGTLITTIAAYASSTSNFNNTTVIIPTAESVYQSESMKLPPSVGSFIILIPNEAHESWQDERHKLITDRNPYYIPKSLVIQQGTTITFLDADAPWDTPHPHTVEVTDSKDGNVVYTTGVLDYTNSSKPTKLPVGNYTTLLLTLNMTQKKEL